MHAKYADIKPKGIVCFGDILAGAFKKVPLAEKTVEKKMEMEEEIKSRVIYKDRDLLVINKSQMVTHGNPLSTSSSNYDYSRLKTQGC